MKLPPNPNLMKTADLTEHVSAHMLGQIFGMTPVDVNRRLQNCAFVVTPGQKTRRYKIKDAAEYLVRPKFEAEDFIAIMKRSELPNSINKEFWDAMLKKQKWEEGAGDLWRTTLIREKLAEMFQNMKFTMQLWVDSLGQQTKLTNDQRELLSDMVDALQLDIYGSLVDSAKTGDTHSTIGEVEYDTDV